MTRNTKNIKFVYSPQSPARGSTPNDVRLDRSRAPTARGAFHRARAASRRRRRHRARRHHRVRAMNPPSTRRARAPVTTTPPRRRSWTVSFTTARWTSETSRDGGWCGRARATERRYGARRGRVGARRRHGSERFEKVPGVRWSGGAAVRRSDGLRDVGQVGEGGGIAGRSSERPIVQTWRRRAGATARVPKAVMRALERVRGAWVR